MDPELFNLFVQSVGFLRGAVARAHRFRCPEQCKLRVELNQGLLQLYHVERSACTHIMLPLAGIFTHGPLSPLPFPPQEHHQNTRQIP